MTPHSRSQRQPARHLRPLRPPAPRKAAARRRERVRWFGWGALAAAAYLGAAIGVGRLPGPLLYDGLIPLPPYRWVHPPATAARDNQPPASIEPESGVIFAGPMATIAR
jgi:hypothetical protein